MPADLTITLDGTPVPVRLGDNVDIASEQAAAAEASAAAAALSEAAAEAVSGPIYANTTAGLAATSDGDFFPVDNGDGTVTIYENDSGSATERYALATTAALASTASNKGAGLSKFSQASTYAANTVGKRMLDLPFVTDAPYNAPADGTDATTEVLAATDDGPAFLPPGVRFTRTDWLASASVGDVVFDFGGVSGFYDSGTTSKQYGITSKDNGPSDTHWYVASNHHAITQLNNFGTAGTDSANARKASILWASGEFQNGPEDMRGYRSVAIQQFTKITGQDKWAWQIRMLAPWLAVTNDYEFWYEGEVISGAGVYRFTGDHHYISTGAGTCGATMPTHTSGTVSDGGVSWTFVAYADISVINVNEEGHFLMGDGDGAATFRHKVSLSDATGDYLAELAARGVSKTVRLRLFPTDGSATEVTSLPIIEAHATGGLRIVKTDNTVIASFSSAGGLTQYFETLNPALLTTTGGTISAANRRLIALTSSGGAQNLDTLSDGADWQLVTILVFDALWTVRNMNGNILLQGAANQAMSQFSTIDLLKIPASISDRWVEVARSLK